MARPRRWYCVFDMGRVVAIINCSKEARRLKAGGRSFRTQIEAEEFAAWWNYQAYLPGGHLWHLTVSTKEQRTYQSRRHA